MDSPEQLQNLDEPGTPSDLRCEPVAAQDPDALGLQPGSEPATRIPPPPSYAAATYDVQSSDESAESIYQKLKTLKTLRERRK